MSAGRGSGSRSDTPRRPAIAILDASVSTCVCLKCSHVRGAGCRFQDVELLNGQLLPLLQNATTTAYFRYFKVSLFCDCPLWPDDGMCALEACSVCECDDHEVPPAWKHEDEQGCQSLRACPLCICKCSQCHSSLTGQS
jgi:Endoplasmic Reticulum Oxidoreductin 1 (ERO1)